MTVSVVIVTHNRQTQLSRCISSLLANTIAPYEIVIIDDSDIGKTSEKSVAQWKAKTPVRIIYHRVFPHKGVSYSRNAGVRRSTGSIIAFIDDDCIADSLWISSIVRAHANYREAIAVTGYVLPLSPGNYWHQVLFLFHRDSIQRVRKTRFLFGCNYSFKRKVFDVFHWYFNESMIHCSEDRYISHVLLQKGFVFLYDPRIRVTHEFRSSASGVFWQWFRYGMSDYYFWKFAPDYHETADADYFRKGSAWWKIVVSPIKYVSNMRGILRYVGIGISDLRLVPGVLYMYAAYYLGVYRALGENFWPHAMRPIGSDDLL